jgi:hypothetical protein
MSWRLAWASVAPVLFVGIVLLSGFIVEGWPRLRAYWLPPDRTIAVPTPWPGEQALDLPIPAESRVLAIGSPVMACDFWGAEGEQAATDTLLEVPASPAAVLEFYRDALIARRDWQPAGVGDSRDRDPSRLTVCGASSRACLTVRDVGNAEISKVSIRVPGDRPRRMARGKHWWRYCTEQ